MRSYSVYEYDAAGNLTSRTLPNGTSTQYGYDADGRLISIGHYKKDTGLICRYNYTLNAMGNRTQVVETTPEGTKTTIYRYDGLDQLETVIYPDSRFVEYGYDPFGNRIRMSETLKGLISMREYT